MRFHSVYVRLTALYVGIIMLISLFFSVTWYRSVSNEVENGLRRQSLVLRQLPGGSLFAPSAIDQTRVQQLQETQEHALVTLIYLNIGIFVLAALSGYFLARRTLEPIEEAVDAQNRFTADASHELRTPLTAMRTEIEVALRGKGTAGELRELLTSNLEEIAKLEMLSSSLLRLAQHDGFVRERDWTVIPVNDLFQDVIERFKKTLGERKIEIQNSEEMEIIGQRESLEELLAILVDNAIKYSPDGTTIRLRGWRQGNQAFISVQDEGMGIKASDLPFIFTRFYRADHSRNKTIVPGYGLGLSIAKKIVELHQGTISVTSQPGKGTTFTIRLSAR